MKVSSYRIILPGVLLSCIAITGTGRAQGEVELGIAASYAGDVGLENHPDVLYFLDFEDQTETMSWAQGKEGYGWTGQSENVYSGQGALEIQQTIGTHHPSEIHPDIEETDVAYVRWYRKWEQGYDFVQHKMSGVYARAPGVGGGGAGIPPNGYDKYSCKLYIDFDQHPRFYSYHPEQSGAYGDAYHVNLVSEPITVEANRWYCFEMMIKANNPPARDGELKMWIDGRLVGHYEDMRFRDTSDLKINEFTYSAYVGGTWVSERDQKLWDDQIVVAKSYIGPLVTQSFDAGPATNDAGSGSSDSSTDGSAVIDSAAGCTPVCSNSYTLKACDEDGQFFELPCGQDQLCQDGRCEGEKRDADDSSDGDSSGCGCSSRTAGHSAMLCVLIFLLGLARRKRQRLNSAR